MQVSVKSNVKDVLRDWKNLERDIKKKAMVRSLNTTNDRFNTQLRRRISQEANLPQSYVKRKMRKIKANGLNLTAVLAADARKVTNLIEWVSKAEQGRYLTPRRTKSGKAQKRPKGVTANAWRTRRVYDGTFIVRGKYSGKPVIVSARQRNYRGRRWSKTIYGPAVWTEFRRYAEEEAEKAVAKHFSKEFDRQIRLLTSRR